jgi:hypothetical protein
VKLGRDNGNLRPSVSRSAQVQELTKCRERDCKVQGMCKKVSFEEITKSGC